MNTLAYEYGTDIMWCDITTPSSRLSPKFAAQWLNRAYGENRHVAINSRCGTITGDFETPEYESSTSLSPRTWEATRGLDPHSFAYNAVTPESAYLNASGIITTLVDIVAKNGNFLLDIGPKGDGSIPEVMKTHLREAGIWIKSHGESIFSTKYWPSGPGDGDFRYTTTDDAFYIHLLTRPNGSVTIPDPVPYLHGDTVTVVGGSKHGTAVKAKVSDDKLTLDVSNEVAMGDKYVWTFKFEY